MAEITLLMILILALVFGFGYAIYIKKTPIDRTYVEVVIGVGLTILFIMLAQFTLYIHYSPYPWWGVLIVPYGFALTGLPMMILQERKYNEQQKDVDDAKNDRHKETE